LKAGPSFQGSHQRRRAGGASAAPDRRGALSLRRPPAHTLWLVVALWSAAVVLDGGMLAVLLLKRPEVGEVSGDDARRAGRRLALDPADAPGEVRLKARGLAGPADVTAWPSYSAARPPAIGEIDFSDASAGRHTVEAGETLSGIARSFTGSTVGWERIAEANGIPPPHLLRVGQTLTVPCVRIFKTARRVEVHMPADMAHERRTRGMLSADVNPLPRDAFKPPDRTLGLVRPYAEALRWDVLAWLLGVVVLVAVCGGLAGFSVIRQRSELRRLAVCTVWGNLAAAGALVLSGGIATMIAAPLAATPELQCVFSLAVALAAGASAYFATYAPLAESGDRHAIERRHAYGVGVSVALVSMVAIAAGWATTAFSSLRFPG
jgi:hypothetical protein